MLLEKQAHMSFCFCLQACHEFDLASSLDHSVVTKASSLIEINSSSNCTLYSVHCTLYSDSRAINVNEKAKDPMQSGPPLPVSVYKHAMDLIWHKV